MPKESTTTLSFPTELSLVTHLSYRLGDRPSIDCSTEIDGITFNYFTDPSLLGAGCYGWVRKGISEDTGQVVAIKNLHPPLKRAESFFQAELPKKLLQSEYDAFVQAHPHQAHPQRYSTCHYDQSQNTMVTPFISGRELSEIHTITQSFDVCSQLTKQIAQLHEKRVTHGDFDDGNNIIVSREGVKLIDFGHAIVHSDRKEQEEKETVSTYQKTIATFDKTSYNLTQKPPARSREEAFDSRTRKQLDDFFKDNERLSTAWDDDRKKRFLSDVRQYISSEKKKTSSDDIHLSLEAILAKIIYENLSIEKLKSNDCFYLKDYFNNLCSAIKKGIRLTSKNSEFTVLKNSLKEVLKCHEESIVSSLVKKETKKAESQIDNFKRKLQETVSNYSGELLSSGETKDIINLVNHEKFFLFLLDLLPTQEKLDILDKIYKNLVNKNEEVTLKSISKIYFAEYRRCANLFSADDRIVLIHHLKEKHTIPKARPVHFDIETKKHFESITQERIQHFIDQPNEHILSDFLMNFHYFYHDRAQLEKQARQAMVIISHIFSDSDEKPQEQSLEALKQSVRIQENQETRRRVFQAFLWIEKISKSNGLEDIKAKLLDLDKNSDFKEFKEQEEKAAADLKEPAQAQQERFRIEAIRMVKERVNKINGLALFFTNNEAITDKKMRYLDAILAHIELIEFESLGEFLKPEILKIRYPDLFQTRQFSFSFWGKRDNPRLTETYKMFEELSTGYDDVRHQPTPIALPSPG